MELILIFVATILYGSGILNHNFFKAMCIILLICFIGVCIESYKQSKRAKEAKKWAERFKKGGD